MEYSIKEVTVWKSMDLSIAIIKTSRVEVSFLETFEGVSFHEKGGWCNLT